MARPGKRQLNVFVSSEAFDGLRLFADDQGVTVTAVIEAIGVGMAALGRLPSQRDVWCGTRDGSTLSGGTGGRDGATRGSEPS